MFKRSEGTVHWSNLKTTKTCKIMLKTPPKSHNLEDFKKQFYKVLVVEDTYLRPGQMRCVC